MVNKSLQANQAKKPFTDGKIVSDHKRILLY